MQTGFLSQKQYAEAVAVAAAAVVGTVVAPTTSAAAATATATAATATVAATTVPTTAAAATATASAYCFWLKKPVYRSHLRLKRWVDERKEIPRRPPVSRSSKAHDQRNTYV